jgi:hypothetical protein
LRPTRHSPGFLSRAESPPRPLALAGTWRSVGKGPILTLPSPGPTPSNCRPSHLRAPSTLDPHPVSRFLLFRRPHSSRAPSFVSAGLGLSSNSVHDIEARQGLAVF